MIIKLPQIADRVTPDIMRSWQLELEKAFQRLYEYARVPAGGLAGQILVKNSGQDYDLTWSPVVTLVASLPAAATAGAGARSFVTNATATTFASVVAGGGANGVPVYSDGTNWRIG
jgi:hypothetical protein